MSFNIVIKRNNSENNKVTKDTTTITTLTGTLKENTSIINPVILTEISMENIKDANYMTISQFDRSYFITDIKSIRNGIVEIYGHVDVLSTYANQIKLSKAIIKRQEVSWNLYLNDGSFRIYQNPVVATKSFPSGFTTQEIVLAIAGS